jgi:hypothetical protein
LTSILEIAGQAIDQVPLRRTEILVFDQFPVAPPGQLQALAPAPVPLDGGGYDEQGNKGQHGHNDENDFQGAALKPP